MVWPTPADFSKRFHLMFNLAVGGAGDWAGTPPDPFGDLGSMTVKAIEIWRFPPTYGQGAEPIPPDPEPPEPVPPDNSAARDAIYAAQQHLTIAENAQTAAQAELDRALAELSGG
jgi:hypothetical protein